MEERGLGWGDWKRERGRGLGTKSLAWISKGLQREKSEK
jgi:hypothetical protein